MYLLPTPQAKSLPLYLTGIDRQPKEGNMYRKQGLEFHQITFVTQGCGKLLLPSEHRLQEGDFFLLTKNTPHHYTNLSDPMQTFWIVFDGSAADVMMELLCGSEGCYVFAPKDGKMLAAKAESLRRMANTNPNPERLSALLYDILAELLTCKNLHGENADLLRRLAPAVTFMEQHCTQEISLEQIAATVGMSNPSFCKLFRKAYQTTPFSYLIQLRLQHAKEMLADSRSVKETALSSGFRDVSYFCTVFRRKESMTPSEFQRRHA